MPLKQTAPSRHRGLLRNSMGMLARSHWQTPSKVNEWYPRRVKQITKGFNRGLNRQSTRLLSLDPVLSGSQALERYLHVFSSGPADPRQKLDLMSRALCTMEGERCECDSLFFFSPAVLARRAKSALQQGPHIPPPPPLSSPACTTSVLAISLLLPRSGCVQPFEDHVFPTLMAHMGTEATHMAYSACEAL